MKAAGTPLEMEFGPSARTWSAGRFLGWRDRLLYDLYFSTVTACAFQRAEVAIPRQMFQEILRLMGELRPHPAPALA